MMTFGHSALGFYKTSKERMVEEVNKNLERKRVLDRMDYCATCRMAYWKAEGCACALALQVKLIQPRLASVIEHPEVGRARARGIVQDAHLGAVSD